MVTFARDPRKDKNNINLPTRRLILFLLYLFIIALNFLSSRLKVTAYKARVIEEHTFRHYTIACTTKFRGQVQGQPECIFSCVCCWSRGNQSHGESWHDNLNGFKGFHGLSILIDLLKFPKKYFFWFLFLGLLHLSSQCLCLISMCWT